MVYFEKIKEIMKPYESVMWLVLPIALVCNAIVFSSDTLPALAFFHVNPALALGLYVLVLTSWFVMYFSSGLKLLNAQGKDEVLDNSPGKSSEENEVPNIVNGIGILNILLNGFTLMGGIAAFMTFCERYGILSAAFLHSNFILVSGLFFLAGLGASYSLTYQRILAAWPKIKEEFQTGRFSPSLTVAIIVAFFTAISSSLFALYCTPLVGLLHIVVPWQLALARVSVALLAFISAFALYFVSLNRQLADMYSVCKKLRDGEMDMPSASTIFFLIISLVAATAFCFTSYHQFAVLFTITNANRGFIIAEVCCQWLAFTAAYFDSYQVLTEELEKCPNLIFMLEHVVVAVLLYYAISAFLIPAIGYKAALLAGGMIASLVIVIDNYIDRNFLTYKDVEIKSDETSPGGPGTGTVPDRVPLAYKFFGERACEVVYKGIDNLGQGLRSYMPCVSS